MFGNLDPGKMLIILVLALVVIGPDRLPKAARQLGMAWRQLTQVRSQVVDEVRSAIPDLGDLPKIPHLRPGSVTSFLNDLTSAPNGAAVAAGAAAVGVAAAAGSMSGGSEVGGHSGAEGQTFDASSGPSASSASAGRTGRGAPYGAVAAPNRLAGVVGEGGLPAWEPYGTPADDPGMN